MNDSIIKRLMLIRLNVMPPYCYDWDESERDVEDYIAHFRGRVPECVAALEGYVKALKAFQSDVSSDENFSRLLGARRVIETLPFADDEIESEASESKGSLLSYLRVLYEREAARWGLRRRLEEYKRALEGLLDDANLD